MMDPYSLDHYTRPKLPIPHGKQPLLLHVCCAVCAGDILQSLVASDIKTTLFFFNPNIHPLEEYERRKKETKHYAKKLGIPCVDGDYHPADWFSRMDDKKNEPERGIRCDDCFLMRLEATAKYASTHQFPIISTTLGISRWKDLDQVNRAGMQAVTSALQVEFWPFNWRKKGGSQRMAEIAKREKFYRQTYCGCIFSNQTTP